MSLFALIGANAALSASVLPISAKAATVTARIWTTVGTIPAGSDLAAGDIVEWKFDISDTSSPSLLTIGDPGQICYSQPLTTGGYFSCGTKTSSAIFSNLTATAYDSSMVPKVSQFSGSYVSGDLDFFDIQTVSSGGPTSPFTSMEMYMGNASTGSYAGIIFPGTSGLTPPVYLKDIDFGSMLSLNFAKLWYTTNETAANTIILNSFLGYQTLNTGPLVSFTPSTEGAIIWNINSIRFSVPGPLPILGSAAAFAYSRKIRARVRRSKSPGKTLA